MTTIRQSMKLSINVPVFNEADTLPVLLMRLLPLVRHRGEVIIAVGGSKDGSGDIAQCAGFTVLRSACGRAPKMNAGAARATGAMLLFLHADTQLQHGAAALVAQALSGMPTGGRSAGAARK